MFLITWRTYSTVTRFNIICKIGHFLQKKPLNFIPQESSWTSMGESSPIDSNPRPIFFKILHPSWTCVMLVYTCDNIQHQHYDKPWRRSAHSKCFLVSQIKFALRQQHRKHVYTELILRSGSWCCSVVTCSRWRRNDVPDVRYSQLCFRLSFHCASQFRWRTVRLILPFLHLPAYIVPKYNSHNQYNQYNKIYKYNNKSKHNNCNDGNDGRHGIKR